MWRPPANPIHKTLAAALLPIGFVIILMTKVLAMRDGSEDLNQAVFLLLWFMGLVMWIWGCCHFAIYRNLNVAWGFLGLLWIVGFLILVWVAKKMPDWERKAAISQAREPTPVRRTNNDPW